MLLPGHLDIFMHKLVDEYAYRIDLNIFPFVVVAIIMMMWLRYLFRNSQKIAVTIPLKVYAQNKPFIYDSQLLKVALRNLWKNKGYSASILLVLQRISHMPSHHYVCMDELSYDKFNEKQTGSIGGFRYKIWWI
jgi:hypothetical protein